MVELSRREWVILMGMARSLFVNAEESDNGYWTIGTTINEEELQLLKKFNESIPTMAWWRKMEINTRNNESNL